MIKFRKSNKKNSKSVKQSAMMKLIILGVFVLISNLQFCLCDTNGNVPTTIDSINKLNITEIEKSDNVTITASLDQTSSSENEQSQKPMMSTGNDLWDSMIKECLKKPTFSCIQKNVYSYLDDALNLDDVNVTSKIKLTRNQVKYENFWQPKEEEPTQSDATHDQDKTEDNEILDFEGRSASPIEEVTNALYGKGVRFIVEHNMEFKLPEVMFDGGSFRISPRSIEGNGMLAMLEFIPKTAVVEARGTSTARILKKIKKFFRKKAFLAVLAVVLVIKIIKVKIFWLLPLLVGVGTAKKLVLKFLLFLFPALSHIFKLCGYYHANYHKTNFHHHKHHIKHLHTVLYDGHHDDHHEHHGHHGGGGLEEHFHNKINHVKDFIHAKHPKGHPSEYLHGGPVPPHQSYAPEQDWELSGPGLGSEYISDINRNSYDFKPKLDDVNEINAWGLGYQNGNQITPSPSYSHNTNPLLLKDNTRLYNVKKSGNVQHSYGPPNRLFTGPSGSASQFRNVYTSPAEDNLIKAQRQEAQRIQKEQQLIEKQQQILNSQPFASDVEPLVPKSYDQFYSPILSKLDRVFNQLGFADENCRERLICSMYKNPTRYSPHSNYVSAELSRDSVELQRPVQSNPAVVRFYKYVQSARDGQDQRDCLGLYSQCNIQTE